PASASFSTPIICSSENLARFIVCPSFRPDSNRSWRKIRGSGQHDKGVHWNLVSILHSCENAESDNYSKKLLMRNVKKYLSPQKFLVIIFRKWLT
ncbi:MAG: hypothetical protein VYB54_06250, partial [Pseudomonadota bacterium]|nr:hypothetical protein [Pseudomonadota bacterium]